MDQIALLLLQSFYLLLPAYFANMAPVIFRKVNFLNVPVDFGYTLKIKKSRGKKDARDRIFGDHKTWRGLFFATVTGIGIAFIQYLIQDYPFISTVKLFPYNNWLLIGFLLGFGAIFGDLVKSFFKRRLHINDGKPLYFFDQLDYVAGSYLFLAFYYVVNLEIIAASIVLSFSLTVIINHLSYYLGIRKEKW
ncbi:TPA: CDP-archaeol synthase [Candidatus Woesearchaeota archaeon]|nr:CDP-archaeol synthase [Candidatus Woesearchaeota archaeon]